MSGLVCVVDASVVVRLFMAEPLAAEAHTLFGYLSDPASVVHVPDLFYAECANIFWKHAQRGTCSAATATSHFNALAKLPLQITPTKDICPDALALALKNGITAYDACYVALAQSKGVPLITAD